MGRGRGVRDEGEWEVRVVGRVGKWAKRDHFRGEASVQVGGNVCVTPWHPPLQMLRKRT